MYWKFWTWLCKERSILSEAKWRQNMETCHRCTWRRVADVLLQKAFHALRRRRMAAVATAPLIIATFASSDEFCSMKSSAAWCALWTCRVTSCASWWGANLEILIQSLLLRFGDLFADIALMATCKWILCVARGDLTLAYACLLYGHGPYLTYKHDGLTSVVVLWTCYMV